MRAPLVIAVAQPLCVPHDVVMNAVTHAATVRSAGARVVVFPELSLTGYELDATAITADDPRLSPIATLAIDGTGSIVAYHKMWLGTAESERFAPGDGPAVYDVDGWRLGLAICKDTGVAQHAADTAALGIDAYVAGTVKSADETALQDERARRVATDHRIWVAVASFAGSTRGGYARAAGRSGIWTPDGVVVTQAEPETGAIARATLISMRSVTAPD